MAKKILPSKEFKELFKGCLKGTVLAPGLDTLVCTDGNEEELDATRQELSDAWDALRGAGVNADGALPERLNEAWVEYARLVREKHAALKSAIEHCVDIANACEEEAERMQGLFDEASEKWQSSDAGDEARELIEKIEEAFRDLDGSDFDLGEEFTRDEFPAPITPEQIAGSRSRWHLDLDEIMRDIAGDDRSEIADFYCNVDEAIDALIEALGWER